jgi:hypothetical protein
MLLAALADRQAAEVIRIAHVALIARLLAHAIASEKTIRCHGQPCRRGARADDRPVRHATNKKIGSITESDLKVLVNYLEKESPEDHDYFIDQATIDYMADGRATDHLVNLLRTTVGSSDGVEIRWERQ